MTTPPQAQSAETSSFTYRCRNCGYEIQETRYPQTRCQYCHKVCWENATIQTPASLTSHESKYQPQAWQQYTLQELGTWVSLLAKRSTHRADAEKRSKDLTDAQNYLDMMQAHLYALGAPKRVGWLMQALVEISQIELAEGPGLSTWRDFAGKCIDVARKAIAKAEGGAQ